MKSFQPFVVLDDICNGTGRDKRIVEVRKHRRTVIAPDGEVGDGGDVHTGLLRELGLGPVFIKPRHGEETITRDVGRIVHADQRVRVARIAHNEHAHVAGGVFLDRFALTDKNLSIRAEQVFALHAGFARRGTDEQTPVHALEACVEIAGGDDALQQRERAILDLHHRALEPFENLRNVHLDQMEDDGLVSSKHFARGDAEQ